LSKTDEKTTMGVEEEVFVRVRTRARSCEDIIPNTLGKKPSQTPPASLKMEVFINSLLL